MQKVPVNKQNAIIRLYLNGWSYREIAVKTGVSLGTVTNIISDLKASQYPEAGDVGEQIETLRELGADLKKHKMTAGQAAVGAAALSRLHELGLEPADLVKVKELSRSLPEEADIPGFIKAALVLDGILQRTGLSFDELEAKVTTLEETASRLEPLAKQVEQEQQHIEELQKQYGKSKIEVEATNKRLQSLASAVREKETRELELAKHVTDLEQRAHDADTRLSAARKDLKTLSNLGLSIDALSRFTARLSAMAQQHNMKSDSLEGRLFHELEKLEEGLGLEALIQAKRKELSSAERKLAGTNEKLEASRKAMKEIHKEQAALKDFIAQERNIVTKEVQILRRLAQDTVAQFKQQLADGVSEAMGEVQQLRNKSLELGHEFGRYQTFIEVNGWLRDLVALINEGEGMDGSVVRTIGVKVLYGIKGWLNRHEPGLGLLSPLILKTNVLIEELERWKP